MIFKYYIFFISFFIDKARSTFEEGAVAETNFALMSPASLVFSTSIESYRISEIAFLFKIMLCGVLAYLAGGVLLCPRVYAAPVSLYGRDEDQVFFLVLYPITDGTIVTKFHV